MIAVTRQQKNRVVLQVKIQTTRASSAGVFPINLQETIAATLMLIRDGRQTDEPMAARPSVAKTKYLTLKDDQLTVAKLFAEGEPVLDK